MGKTGIPRIGKVGEVSKETGLRSRVLRPELTLLDLWKVLMLLIRRLVAAAADAAAAATPPRTDRGDWEPSAECEKTTQSQCLVIVGFLLTQIWVKQGQVDRTNVTLAQT